MKSNTILLNVKVKPNSKKNEVVRDDNILIVTVTDAPVDGKANEKVLELLAKFFDMPKSKFKILHGKKSRNKIIELKESN